MDEKLLTDLGAEVKTGFSDLRELVDKRATVEEVEDVKKQYAGLLEEAKLNKSEAQQVAADIADLKKVLAHSYGKTGAEDWLTETQKFIIAAYKHKTGGQMSPVEKAVVDFTITGTDTSAGYLVPDSLKPGIDEIKDIYGNIYPRVTKFQMPWGGSVKMNQDSARPVAAWRGTQGATITEEPTPMAFGQDTLVSELLGTYIKITNELLMHPGVGFAAVAVSRMVRAVLTALEFGILQGDASGSTQPSDGILIETGPNDQTNLAATTLAAYATFLDESIEDYEWLFDTTANQILIPPREAVALMAQQVHATNLPGSFAWGSPREGIPATLFGYELIAHPAMVISTTSWTAMGDLSGITLGEGGTMAIDFNPLGEGWTHNESWLRVFDYYDWNLGILDSWSKADYT